MNINNPPQGDKQTDFQKMIEIQHQQQLQLKKQKEQKERDPNWWKNIEFTMSTEQTAAKEKMEREYKLLIETRKHVVKLYSSTQKRSFVYPWQMRNSVNQIGSGFIYDYENKQILTNAHCVADSGTLTIQRYGSPFQYDARILVIGYQHDLALLTVDDEKFWKNDDEQKEQENCVFADLPQLQSHATVIGFPVGGNNLSITRGVVSRIEMRTYVNCSLLCIQIDAQITPGNSGGPTFDDDGRVIGIAMQYIPNMPNIGYIIPTEVIQHFLNGVRKNKGIAPSICFTGLTLQYIDNDSQRVQRNIQDKGVLVIDKVYGNLLPGDVILAVDGHEIFRPGTVMLRPDELLHFNYYVRQKYLGESVEFTVKRKGEILTIEHLLYDGNCLVPDVIGYNCEPAYIMMGGLVFIPLSIPYLQEAYGSDWNQKAPFRILMDVYHGEMNGNLILNDIMEEIVCISLILPHQVNKGYAVHHVTQVTHFNGKRIFNMVQFLNMILESQEDFFCFKMISNHEMTISRQAALGTLPDLIQTHHMGHWYSENLDTHYHFKKTIEVTPPLTKKFVKDTIFHGVSEQRKRMDDAKICDTELSELAKLSTPMPLPTNQAEDAIFDQ